MPDLRVVLFYSVFESFFLIYLGISLLGARINKTKFLLAGLVYTGVPVLVRWIYWLLGIPLGTHALLNLTALITLLRLATGMNWPAVFGASLSVLILLFSGEIFMFLSFVKLVPINNNVFYRIILGYASLVPAVLALVFIKYYNVNIFTLGRNRTLAETGDNLENTENEKNKGERI
jgi:hypothetical protein